MISVQNLTVTFGATRAVDDLTLEVAEGALLGLLGPNGAGKSTTIACIAGLRRPQRGDVTVGGVDVGADPRAARRLLGVVPQALALYPSLSVRRNLRIFAGLAGVAADRIADRIEWGLDLAQLAERADARVGTLSGGMQRRLNLAAALLHAPPIIICDEPTTGVDPQSRNHIFETIRRLHAEGRTVIYTTHYMEEVEALCERVAIIDRGRLVAHDDLAALLDDEQAAKVALHFDRPVALEALESALESLGSPRIERSRRSLEALFLELTGRALRDGPTPAADEAQHPKS